MSASALVTIFCDAPNCGVWDDAGIAETAGKARAQLAKLGWEVNVAVDDGTIWRSYRKDFCPKHKGVRR